MARLTSSWHSSSLTFVSSQNHQPPPPVRPLSTPTNPRTFVWPSRATMAKIVALVLFVLLVMIVAGFVIGESTSEQGQAATARSKQLRAKSLTLKRKRIGGRRAEETPNPRENEQSEAATTSQTAGEEGIASGESQREAPATTARPKPKKTSRSNSISSSSRSERPARDSTIPVPEGCGECDQSSCKNLPESSCHAGLVMDRCSCCLICGSGEGNRCFNASIPNLSYNSDVGMCGTGLSCLLRKDLDPTEPLEALCECRDRRLVCGNDNQTYISECKLREAAHSRPGLAIASWGPCVTAPWMPSPLENITVSEGEDASLSCEVKGFPSAVIHWEFLPTVSNGAPVILPGDDSSVVVTVRGGPEQTMSTSWIQIISVNHAREGLYYCVAKNSEGAARSLASVKISKGPNEGTLPAPDNFEGQRV